MKICRDIIVHSNLYKGLCFVILSSLFTCIGQLLWKLSIFPQHIILALVGLILYGFGALLLIYALRFGELSVFHPMLGVGYVFSIILGSVILGEPLTINKVVAIAFIVLGLFFISKSTEE